MGQPSINELAEQLTDIYLTEEDWHDERMGREEALNYHRAILANGQCLTVTDDERLAGYCEFYINEGVCYVANLFIRAEYRGSKVMRILKKKLFQVAKGTKIFLGDRHKFNKKESRCHLRSNNGRTEEYDK